mmetsp:Transcript_10367/g.34024  ORF Transcript_10367/g.34024 Transcript_10367/m.34024 type:complete len:222 (-) Transcript_10367:36-701(-)
MFPSGTVTSSSYVATRVGASAHGTHIRARRSCADRSTNEDTFGIERLRIASKCAPSIEYSIETSTLHFGGGGRGGGAGAGAGASSSPSTAIGLGPRCSASSSSRWCSSLFASSTALRRSNTRSGNVTISSGESSASNRRVCSSIASLAASFTEPCEPAGRGPLLGALNDTPASSPSTAAQKMLNPRACSPSVSAPSSSSTVSSTHPSRRAAAASSSRPTRP